MTQADVDRGTLTNIATSSATPAFGQLGSFTDTVTLTGPVQNSVLNLSKTASPTSFTAINQTITYTFTATNAGNTTLTNVVVTDPKIPALSCTIGTLLPLSTTNTVNTATCTGTYRTTQADVDAFARSNQPLTNTATVRGTDPRNTQVSRTATANVPGPAALPTLTIDKTAVQTTYSAVGAVIAYRFDVTNTGNVTWPSPPTVTDTVTAPASCPSGAVAPGATVRCTVNYSVTQADIDRGQIDNTATATITINGVTRSANDSHSLPATLTLSQSIVKRLKAGTVTPFTAVGDPLVYEYVLKNTGNASITNPVVTDNKVAVTCPVGVVAPGASVICTSATYSVTQQDLDAGQVVNTATANGTGPLGGAVPPVTTSLRVDAQRLPALTMDKVAETIAPEDFAPGLPVDYTYTVTNTGNVTITAPITVTDDKTPVSCPALPAGGLSPTAPNNTLTCTATYVVTNADFLNGLVTNNAFATDGQTQSNTDSATIPQNGTPGLSLAKTALTASFADVGDTIDYRFTVTNSGETNIIDLQPISITDAKIDPATLSCAQPPVLAPTESFDCLGTSVPLTQADVDSGSYANTAHASFDFTRDGNTTLVQSATATAVVLSSNVPDFTVVKSGPSAFSAVGEVITYSFAVSNLNAQTLTSVVLTDPLIPGLSCPISNLQQGAPQTCQGTYTVTQADLDRGMIDNTVTAVGTGPQGGQATRTDDLSIAIDPAAATKVLTFDKTASVTSFDAPGDVIDYTLTVTNDGNLTLTNVVVTDSVLGLSCTIPSLAPTATDDSCRGSYTITQADIDAGDYVNAAQAVADDVAPQLDSVTVAGPTLNSAIALTKAASNAYAAANDPVVFTFQVENTGNVTQTGVVITDEFFDPDLVCNVPDLQPGEVDNSCTATYTVTQDDVDAGTFTNTARVDATGGNGIAAFDEDTAIASGPAAAPAVRIEKSSADGVFGATGTSEVFTFEVYNTGNVTLTSVAVSDPLTGFACTTGPILPGASTTLCDDTSPMTTAPLLVTQANVDAGTLSNTVSATAQSLRGGPVSGSDTLTLAGPTQLPALSIDKQIAAGDDFATVGATVSYNFVVQNAGNITLTQPITINDAAVPAVCPALPAGGLAPLATLTCTGSKKVTQADLDRGYFDNTASASVTQPVVPSATYPGGTAAVTSATDTVRANADQLPALSLVKRVKPLTPSSFSVLNAPIVYQFIVKNSGNVTTTADTIINDVNIPANLTCAPAGLAPGASATCETTWNATQAALDAGFFTNTASATTAFDGAAVTSPDATATVNAVQNPRLVIAKTITDVTPANAFQAGTVLTYQYVITNPLTGPGTPGNVTIDGPFSVADNRTTVTCTQPASGALAPGESTTCTATYTVVSDDLDLGSVQNTASASGTFNGATITSPKTVAIYPVDAKPAVDVEKVADPVGATFSAVGDKLYYSYTVINPVREPGQSGVALVEPVFIQDDKLGNFECRPRDPAQDFNIGDRYTCNTFDLGLPYVVTQADLDRGFVTNEATAQTTFARLSPSPIPVESSAVEVTITGAETPGLTLTKAVTTGPAVAVAGDALTYTIRATNSGNQTLRGVVVTDPLIPALTCDPSGTNITLLPTEFVECTGTYTVTQADIDADDVLSNTASAQATDPQGDDVLGSVTNLQDLDPPLPAVAILKEQIDSDGTVINPPVYNAVGEVLTFRMTVTNTGNITLDNVAVTDSLVAGTCNVSAPLAPGDIDNSCLFTYAVTQTDIDDNTIANQGSVTADPRAPGTTLAPATSDLISNGPVREPKVSLTKSVDQTSFSTTDVALTYGYVIANEGNITLTDLPQLTDDKIPAADLVCDAFPATGLLPGDAIECRGTYLTTQADVNAGFVTNIADVTIADPLDPLTPLTSQDTQTVAADRVSAVTLTKLADDDALVVAGQVITYSYQVTNTGNTTLTNISVGDQHTSAGGTSALTLSNSGAIASLVPLQSVTLTATYTVTQADVDANTPLTNTATLSSVSPDGVNPSAVAEESVSVALPAPDLLATKSVATQPTGAAAVGDDIVYAITVANTGNVSLSSVTFDDVLTRSGGAVVTPAPVLVKTGGDTLNPDILDVGEVWTYSATHELTQDDIDAGGLSNVLTVTATDPNGTDVDDLAGTGTGDNEDPATVTLQQAGALEGTKTLEPLTVPAVAGTVVTFRVTLANTGNVTLRNVVLTDDLRRADDTAITPLPVPVKTGGDAGLPDVLEVGETWTYDVLYTLEQADIDAGGITNSLTFAAQTPANIAVTDVSDDGIDDDGNTLDDPAELLITPAPLLEVTKVVRDTGSAVGDVVVFEITAENLGNVSLRDLTISDTFTRADGSVITGAVPVLADPAVAGDPLLPNGTRVWTLSHTLTQVDLDAGGLVNTATVTGLDPSDAPISDVSDNGVDGDGNTADDATALPIAAVPGIELTKVLTTSGLIAGDPVVFTLTAVNTGNVSLSDIALSDTFTRADGTAITGAAPVLVDPAVATDPLLPTETRVWTLSYTLTQPDIDAGGLANTATVAGTLPGGGTRSDVSDNGVDGDGNTLNDPTLLPITPAPLLEVTKIVRDTGSAVGDVVVFEITAENLGNVSLRDLTISDTFTRADGTVITGAVPVLADPAVAGDPLLPNGVRVWTLSRTLTQADVDAGGLVNTATVTGLDPSDAPISDVSDNGVDGDGNTADDATVLPIAAVPALAAVKVISSGPVTVGSLVVFDINVTNTGNVTLRSVAIASDTLTRADGTALTLTSGPVLRSSDQNSPAGTLAVNETGIWRATYRLTQADVDAGGIANIAVATGTAPGGTVVTAQTVDADAGDGNPAVLTIPATPALRLVKVLTAGGPTFSAVGDVLDYRFDVTNTGNVTLTDAITIVDARITDAGGTISCPSGPLAPLARTSCTASYAVTQADIDAGSVTNTALAQSGAVVSAPSSVTVQAQQTPALEMVKTAVSIFDGTTTSSVIEAQYFVIDAVVTYNYVVTNTGNTTITDAITVTDNLTAVSCPVLPDGLAPAAQTICESTYTVTGNDVTLTAVTNTARAIAGPVRSPITSETVPLDGVPSLGVSKALVQVNGVAGTAFTAVGDVLTYQFIVENTGNVSFARDVSVTDTLLTDPVVCFDSQGSTRDLASGDTAVCTAPYTVNQDDLDRGQVINEAVATTLFGADGDTTLVSSRPARVVSAADVTSALTLVKSAATLPITAAGQVLTYTLTIENTGNQRLRSVAATDALLPDLSCAAAVLEPGAQLICADTYTVTQADVDAGTLVNTADVSAITPTGAGRTATDTLTLDTPAARNALSLSKVPSVSPFGLAGSTVTFDLVLRNDGNLTLFDLVVTDPSIDAGYSCTVAELAPGDSNSDCSVSRAVTQADVDAGSLSNTAFVAGEDAQGNAVAGQGSVIVPGPINVSALEVTKVVRDTGSAIGDVVVFEITAENLGNVSLRDLTISDTFTRADGSVITGAVPVLADPAVAGDPLLPNGTRVWTLSHTLTQVDLDAGGLVNTATVTGLDPSDAPISDVSDNGVDGDGNTADDATVLPIAAVPGIELTKVLTTSGLIAGDPVVFTLTAVNTGNVSLSDIALSDTFTRADGTVITGAAPVLVDPAVATDPLLPTESRVWTLSYTLTQADIDAGGLANTATVAGTLPGGVVLTDVSDNGVDGDGNTLDDPTLLPISTAPGLEVTKVLSQTGSAVGDVIVYQITVENTGNVTLTELVVTDTMTDMAGNPRDSGAVVFVSGNDARILDVGATNLFEVTYTLTQEDLDAGGLINSAVATVETTAGGVLTDSSDNGLDDDGNTTDDPTVLLLDGISSIAVTKSAGTWERRAADRVAIDFTIEVENTGTVTQTGLQVIDDLQAFASPGRVIAVTRPVASGFEGTGSGAAGFNGKTNIDTLSGDVNLAVGQTGAISFTVLIDPTAGYPAQENVALAKTDRIVDGVSGAVAVPALPDADVRVVKLANTETAILGGTVGYTLTFENMNQSVETGLTLIDSLPDGLAFTPGSARYDGADTPQPVVSGRLLEWQNITLGPLQKVTITLDTRVTGGDGNLTNTAYVLDPGQNIISNRAEATVTRRPEAVFDCGDVIGKVYDDRNMNGYQDGPTSVSRAQITDQTYIGGKNDPAITALPQGEPGLAGVRLSTVSGTIITTDAFGRFSVPCAELPADIGSNFTLKLDTRTLPTGYRVTTENPRVVRLTPGTVTKMNFGAAIANVVDIDLTAEAFVSGTATPIPALPAGVDSLIAQIRDVPSVLRLSYYLQGEDRALARARMDAVEEIIRVRWRQTGRYRLLIERTIQALQ
ncbi:conserved repeat domain-containing protein [Loktanella salsilacus]|uniref:Conserved repeat domain-containing protein n=1 Tax=Loktanella salsilacus TaxID=195913 RepID=A0A1I4HVI7_9RHOB|nr:DUF11 domain-containing protein [Loktanella salsilacus]SFL45773.1 conserved repeat domain-containing protein [Loktanella salsilacus]